ncbi:MAG: outer membrane beta-barrel family protein [Prevotellaceae bacterium]|nr:outer membrane beta-barrel family protein [Prevotellaceae bacterium]
MLEEVVVKATKVKMFYRGDTLVYNADAFKLPNGSMLDALIAQMPGVTINKAGEIFVNGRKVDELMLGSRSFFKGNSKVLLENLPYYTVKEINVYDRQSDKSKALGYDVDAKSFVMDVSLKQEYHRGYTANVEGAVGTKDRWLGRAFLLSFTDHKRYTLLGNLNNVNELRHVEKFGNWTPSTMPRNLLTTRSIAGEIDHHGKGSIIKNNLSVSYTSTTDVCDTRSRYEKFLQGVTPTSLTESFNKTGNHRWNVHDNFTLTKSLYLHVESDFYYSKTHNRSNSIFDQWTDSLTVSQLSRSFVEGNAWSGKVEASGAFRIGTKQKNLGFNITVEHREDNSESVQRYCTTQYTNHQQTILHNADDVSNRTTSRFASVDFSTKLFKSVDMQLSDKLFLIHTETHDYLYHPDTLTLASQIDALSAITDLNNSYDSGINTTENTFNLSFSGKGEYKMAPNSPLTIGYQRWSMEISVPIRHESIDYQRGRLDTLATQTTLFVNTSATFRKVSKDSKSDFRARLSHKRNYTSIFDCITYRDDSQPLIVKLGNPDLKNSVTTNLSTEYYNKKGKNQQQWHVGASADFYHRQTAQSVSYNIENGVYTYQPVNVEGAYRLNAKFDISRAIDKNRYWTWQTNADATLYHNIDYAMLTGMTESEKNIVNTLTLHDGAYIQYNKGALNVRVMSDIRWRHSKGRMYDFETLNATDFQYGLSARYTIPILNTTISTDGNIFSRRGYGSSELNTDDVILNVSVSQPFFKGKLIARFEAFDIFHQLSSTQYEVNAQGRTETWHRSLPQYVMVHLVYHWNKNPKRQ